MQNYNAKQDIILDRRSFDRWGTGIVLIAQRIRSRSLGSILVACNKMCHLNRNAIVTSVVANCN